MVKRIRNKACLPYVGTEGVITKPFPLVGVRNKGVNWYDGLSPYERLNAHQTLASVRRYAHFKRFSGLIPLDRLDLVLASCYDHTDELFADTVDTVLQPETIGKITWRRLRNSRDLPPERDATDATLLSVEGKQIQKYSRSHPVLMGGVTEKEHPSHVKLMNSSHHSSQTNAGYSRQDRDGTVFHY